jgi:hypothetical protein
MELKFYFSCQFNLQMKFYNSIRLFAHIQNKKIEKKYIFISICSIIIEEKPPIIIIIIDIHFGMHHCFVLCSSHMLCYILKKQKCWCFVYLTRFNTISVFFLFLRRFFFSLHSCFLFFFLSLFVIMLNARDVCSADRSICLY